MAITRINNNQVSDAISGNAYLGVNAAVKVQDYTVTAGKLANNITYNSDLVIAGNLTVTGNTTTVDTYNLIVEDPLILLADGQTGSPTLDIGYIGKRGTSNNIAFVWDESASEFVTIYTTSETTNTVVTISSYADFHTANANIGGNIVVNGTTSLSGNLIGPVNATGTITGGSLATAGTVSATGNVTGGNVTTAGLITATGNVTGGNILTGGLISATGTITSSANISGGNILTGGLISSTGSITSNNGITATGNVTGGNVTTGGLITATGNIQGGNFLTGGLISATGNVTSGNVNTGIVSASGNITGANVNVGSGNVTGGNLSVTGNVYASNFIGNISGNIDAAGSNTQVQFNDTGDILGASANFTFNKATNILTVVGTIQGTTVSATANVVAGNVTTGGLISATGNVLGGNIFTGGLVSATGNGIFGNVSGTNITGTTVSASGNVIGSNLTTGGLVSATGNVIGGNLTTTGLITATGSITSNNGITATGNVTGGNVTTAGLITATGSITSANGITATGNVTGGNVTTGGLITATGNVTGGNVTTAGQITAGGNVTGANFLTTGLISATGNIRGGNLITASITTNSGDLILNSAGGALQWDGAGNIVMNNQWINNLSDPVQAQDAATKEYVDNAVSTGITIHTPVYVESPNTAGSLAATYTQGGTTATVTDTIAGNTVVFSTAVNPQVNDQLWFSNSFQGILANTAYFVVSAPNTSAAVLSTAYNGAPVSNITSASGLTQSVRINSGVGAYLTANANGQLTVDGINPPANARVLVYNQTNGAENGVYVVTQAGNVSAPYILTRSSDQNKYIPDSITGMDAGDYFYVEYGDTGAGESYVLTSPTGPIILGYTPIVYTQFSASQVYTANTSAGLVLNGTVFSAKVDNNTTAFDGGGNIIVKAGANLTTPNIGAATGTSLSVTGNVTGGNVNTNGLVSATGNVIGGNVTTIGLITATGSITGGNLLTGGLISAAGNLTSGNVNTTNISLTGNVVSNLNVTANITGGNLLTTGLLSATGNVTGGNVTTAGLITATGSITSNNGITATGNVTGGNVTTGGLITATGSITSNNGITATGNVTGGNVTTGGLVTATGNVLGGNLVTSGLVTATGNVTGGNIVTTGQVTAGGNVYAGTYFIGDGGLLSNISAAVTVTKIVNGTSYANIAAPNGNLDIAINNNVVETVASTGVYVTGINSVTGNVIAGNVTTAGLITATGNVTGGNIVTGGLITATGSITSNNGITATGNVTGGNVTTGGLITATGSITSNNGITATGNVTGGNVTTAGLITATGNVLGGNLVTSGLVTATGNVTGGNVTTGGLITATGNVTGGNILTSGLVSAGGNVTGSSLLGTQAVIGTSFTPTLGATVTINATDSLLLPVGNTFQRPSGVAGMTRFNTTSGTMEYYDGSSWQSTSAAFTVITDQQFAGNGVQTIYTLSANSTTAATIVSINGVVQIPTSAYSVSGNQLTFTEPPSITDTIDVRALTTTTTVTAIQNVSGNAVVETLGTADTVQITGNLLPISNVTYDLGSPSLRWRDGWFSGTSLHLGNVTIKNVPGGNSIGFYGPDGTTPATIAASSVDTTQIANGTSNMAVIASGGNIQANVGGATIITIASTGIINGQANGVGNIGTATGYFNTIFAKATSAQYADLAEMYEADAIIEPGTVVSFGGTKEITVCSEDNSRRIAGVVSTNPSYIMNAGLSGDHVTAVALTGRVPTKVTGCIRKGDMLVSAGGGRARAEADPAVGTVIGKALADFDGVDGVIEVVVGRI